MGHSIDFFRDEVRNGFYIPTAIKQAWAASLDVLTEIDRVCEKYGIKYFADWGTLLGAVRHGGFVPWDDDLDICMLRDDYTRFREVADKELPEQFVIHDYARKEDHWLFLSRVVNNSRICFDKNYLNEHNNFPWLAGVDIFVKDYLYTDDKTEKQRDKEVMNILALADGITNGTLNMQSVIKNIYGLVKEYSVDIPTDGNERDTAVALYRLAELQMSRVNPEETDRVGQIFPWVLKNGPAVGEKKEYYEKVIRLPFEDTKLPVPAAYNMVLSGRYGNYCEIHKVWSGHDYPFFEAQKADMELLSGESFDRFRFDRSMLEHPAPDNSNSLKTISKECLRELQAMLNDAENMLAEIATIIQEEDAQSIQTELQVKRGGGMPENLPEEFSQLISDSQQLAADLGTLVEQIKGEERDCTKRVIAALQEYCDVLWMEYQELTGEIKRDRVSGEWFPNSRKALELVSNSVKYDILERKEALFLPIGGNEWKNLKPFYNIYSIGCNNGPGTDTNTDTYVVPLPLLRKTVLGEVTMTDEEIREAVHLEDYPESISYVYKNWMTYDFSLHCPDVVYIQNPYDDTNPLLTVPSAFFASNIRRFADKIIYIPALRTAEFDAEDRTDQYNLKHYITAPGIIFSDEMIVWSENIKEQYVNALTLFAGEETRDIWLDRIKLIDDQADKESVASRKAKKVLYCIGANELTEHKDILMKAVSARLKIFGDAGKSMHLTIVLYPGDRKSWDELDPELFVKLFELFDRGVVDGKYDMLTFTPQEVEEVASAYDAYYGSPSPLVTAFAVKKKPVMLANYEINIGRRK